MIRSLFFSYKGGIGRTTALANVAGILARDFQRSVVIVDADLECAGLHHVLGLRMRRRVTRSLQAYLDAAPGSLETVRQQWVRDPAFVQDVGVARGLPAGALRFIGASFAPAEPVFVGRRFHGALKLLLSAVQEELQPDLLLVDSPSGLGVVSATCIGLTQRVYVFTRWSRQFARGTLAMLRFLRRRAPRVQLFLVPSLIPPLEPEAEAYDERAQAAARVRSTLAESVGGVLPGIVTTTSMQWEEQELAFLAPEELQADDRAVLAAYTSLAHHLDGAVA